MKEIIQETEDKNFTILIIDDVPANLKLLSQMLIEQGYTVKCVKSGAMALVTLNINQPDLILLDVNLPDMNGYEICENLKKNEVLQDIPIIFLTVSDDLEYKIRGFQVGGADYITKPFHIQEVIARVNNQIKITRQKRQLRERVDKYQQNQEKLQELALIDPVTGVPNRRCFNEHLEKEWRQHLQERAFLTLIMADIDHFKLYNDTYGHIQGDMCLQTIARTLYDLVNRPGDLVARYGGEEFALVLANTTLEQGEAVARRILEGIKNLAISHPRSPLSDRVTLSLGIAAVVPDVNHEPTILIQRADQALYCAKINGRNGYISFI
ncbi:MAG: diguanylate cyclase [Chlorogloea purpurea SAG 13.99]|nr:diguanylate cyclase [Chlorogloea purpurea SAG 13.99]